MNSNAFESAQSRLVLASTSRYRAELLRRLTPDFCCIGPEVDETPLPDEPPEALAVRLARAKSQAVAAGAGDNALVIGSDQVLICEGEALGKPEAHARALAMLRGLSGRDAEFHTAVCVTDTRTGRTEGFVDCWRVRYRTLSDADIERYLMLDAPFDCAGAIRTEAHGPLLLDKIEGGDPSALIGLPLVPLAACLRRMGLDLLHASHLPREA